MHVKKLIEMRKQADEYELAISLLRKQVKLDDLIVTVDVFINLSDDNTYKVVSNIEHIGKQFHKLTSKELYNLTKLKEQLDRWCSGEGEYPV